MRQMGNEHEIMKRRALWAKWIVVKEFREQRLYIQRLYTLFRDWFTTIVNGCAKENRWSKCWSCKDWSVLIDIPLIFSH